MKRAQKEALAASCAGGCPAAQQLTADLEESAAALDREAEENRALQERLGRARESIRLLQEENDRLRQELARARALRSCRRGLSA